MIGIVGGGFAGLASAYRLKQAGFDVHIFESQDDLGGLAATYDTRGDPIEKFYHHLSATEKTIERLANDLGVNIEWLIGKNAYYVDGVVHPLDTPWQIAAFPPLSVYDKFRLTMLTLGIDVRSGIPAFDTYDDLEAFDDVPLREFVREHATENVYTEFFDPLLDAKFGSRKDDISAAWLLGRIRFRGERDFLRGEVLGYPTGGFQPLTTALIDAVGRGNITTGARVSGIEMTDTGVESIEVSSPSGSQTHDVSNVIVATMPNVLEELTGYECGIEFQGTVCATASFAEPITDTYWLNIADEAPFGVFIEHTNYIPPERYGGEHLVYLASYVQDPEEALWQMTDAEVREYWLAGVRDLFPHVDEEHLNWMEVARNPRTAPIYDRGYLDRVVPYDLSEGVGDGVYYAGMASRAQYPERSLNGAIEAGFACADAIIQTEDSRASGT